MLVKPTFIQNSGIHGIGLFAATPIKKGEIIWKYVPDLDIGLTTEQVDALPEVAKKTFLNYLWIRIFIQKDIMTDMNFIQG